VQPAPTAQHLDPIVVFNWLATAEFPPASSPQKMTTSSLGNSDLMVDGRWSIAIAIAIAIKYSISSAAWIGAVSKLVALLRCVEL
jgi:hypothetical protein